MVKSPVVRNQPIANETAPCRDCPVKSVALCGQLHEARGARVDKLRLGFRQVRARRTILREGDIAREVFTLYSGWAFRLKVLFDGRRQILSFYLPGDLITARSLDGLPVHYSVQAASDVTLCAFSMLQYKAAIYERPELLEQREAMRRDYFLRLDELVIDLGRRSAQERIVRLILEFYVRQKARHAVERNSFEFPLRQEHLADALGLTVVHVSRTLGSLRAQKLISFTRDRLTIHDLPKLAALGALDKAQLASLHGA